MSDDDDARVTTPRSLVRGWLEQHPGRGGTDLAGLVNDAWACGAEVMRERAAMVAEGAEFADLPEDVARAIRALPLESGR